MKLATLCYLQKDNKTLMIHRIKKKNDVHAGKWNGLGGKLKEGETPEEGVLREVLEESGFKLKDPILKGFLTFPAFSESETWYVFVFRATDFSGKLSKSDEGELEWVDNRILLEMNLWEGDRYFIPWLSEDKFFSAKFVYKNGELVEHSELFY